jgi:type II secretory pathway component PulC
MNTRSLPLVVALLAVGCGGAAQEVAVGETNIADEILAGSHVEEPIAFSPPGTVARADLDALLAGGPGPVLALVVTEPHKRAGRFVGFRIVSFTQGEPTAVDLRAGDVVLAINDRRIERPEHLFEVYEQLKTADELSFEIERAGRAETLTYPIEP